MLEFQNVFMAKKQNKILDGLTLQVPDGALMGLLGVDGQAKSMLLSTACGSAQPDSGLVLLNGVSIYRQKSNAYISFGYMPKNYGFYDMLRVEEYYDMFLSLYKINGRYRSRRMEEVLEWMGLEGYGDVFISEIPVDVLPFLCLGKTILHEPEWLLLDEPFQNLDASARKQMIRILLMLHEQGMSMIVNTSLFPEFQTFFTDVAVLEKGKILVDGPIEEVYESAQKQSPVRMKVLAGLDEALAVLKENELVERVIVDGNDCVFRFNGGEREEAELLTDLVASGALIHSYLRDRINIEEIFRG